MFGAHGVYADGLCFACMIRGDIYMKGDALTAPVFEAAGCARFTYDGHSGTGVKMPYWALAISAYGDPQELKRWCAMALEAARRQAAKKAVATARKPKKAAALP